MKNKENNLEKKAGIAGKLKNTIESIVTPLIPLAFLSDKLSRTWSKKGEKLGNTKLLFINAAVTGGIIGIGGMYLLASRNMGTLNYTKWSEASKQKEIQAEKEIRVDSNRQFYKVDKNNDSVIDSNEFYDYTKGQRK